MLPYTRSCESTQDLLLGSGRNIEHNPEDLLGNGIAELHVTPVTGGCTHPAAAAGSGSRHRAGRCKAFFRCLHPEELPSQGQEQLFSQSKYCAFLNSIIAKGSKHCSWSLK